MGTDDVVLDSLPAQMRGVIGRYPDAGQRYVFEFDSAKPRWMHMLGVRRPLLITWLRDGDVVAQETLRPWIGHARHVADTVIEQRPRGY